MFLTKCKANQKYEVNDAEAKQVSNNHFVDHGNKGAGDVNTPGDTHTNTHTKWVNKILKTQQ